MINKHRPKCNFTVGTLTRAQVTLWTKDDLIFVPERYRIQVTFLINVFNWTGARLSAFFAGGLRYEVRLIRWSRLSVSAVVSRALKSCHSTSCRNKSEIKAYLVA